MCQNNCDDNYNGRILVEEDKLDLDASLLITGLSPIKVTKSQLGDLTKYEVSTIINNGSNGNNGKDGKDGLDAVNPTITIGNVISGNNPSVINVGTPSNAILDIILPKGNDGQSITGDKGKDGVNGKDGINGKDGTNGLNGITLGLKGYKFSPGNTSGSYTNMGNFNQGTYIDLGDSSSKKLRIKAWVTIASMRNWITLRLTSSTTPSYQGTLVSQRVKHSEATLYVGQYDIDAYLETTDRYIGFTFSDTPGGNYNSDGAQYGDYGIEVFILD